MPMNSSLSTWGSELASCDSDNITEATIYIYIYIMIGYILAYLLGLYKDNGKENGNY